MEQEEILSFRAALEAALEGQKNNGVQKNRFNASLDLKVLDCDEENRSWVDYMYERKEEHLNPYDGIHGGVICGLADTCAGVSIAVASGHMPSTTDLSCSYLRPMLGNRFRIHVDLNQIGHRLAGSSCSIYEMESRKLCVTSMLKYVLMSRPTDL